MKSNEDDVIKLAGKFADFVSVNQAVTYGDSDTDSRIACLRLAQIQLMMHEHQQGNANGIFDSDVAFSDAHTVGNMYLQRQAPGETAQLHTVRFCQPYGVRRQPFFTLDYQRLISLSPQIRDSMLHINGMLLTLEQTASIMVTIYVAVWIAQSVAPLRGLLNDTPGTLLDKAWKLNSDEQWVTHVAARSPALLDKLVHRDWSTFLVTNHQHMHKLKKIILSVLS